MVAPYTYSRESDGNYKYDKPYIRDKYGVLKQTEIDIFIGVYDYSHGDSYGVTIANLINETSNTASLKNVATAPISFNETIEDLV